ncbi:MAG: hypothetical protein JXO22_11400, partial [Phycisphaerae bacterium]|nr:hypothetical protein [Phycisphaerae bacterium]
MVADVAIDARVQRLYSYGVPETLCAYIQPGVVVRVPFGRADRLVDGLCVRVTTGEWDHTKRPIADASRLG